MVANGCKWPGKLQQAVAEFKKALSCDPVHGNARMYQAATQVSARPLALLAAALFLWCSQTVPFLVIALQANSYFVRWTAQAR